MRFSWLDVKLAFRMLGRYPGLTVVGGLATAFAIWVGAGSFELINQWVNPRLPLDEGERIVGVQLWDTASSRPNPRALHDFIDWREQLTSIEDLSAFTGFERNLTDSQGGAAPVNVAAISASAFRLARVAALHGRHLLESDESAGAPPVMVIGYDVWKSRFGGDRDVIGRTVRLGSSDTTVVGVMPEAFKYPISFDGWIPFRFNALNYPRGRGPEIRVLGRLAPGISWREAQSELTSLGERSARDFPRSHAGVRPRILPYADSVNPIPASELFGLRLVNLFVVMLVLLVCGNVGLLMFARAATRENEIVVRNALGASRRRIIVQLFSEALVLCAIGALVGIAAARFGVRWGMLVIETNVGRLPFWVDDDLSWTTLLYAAALAVVGAIVAGVMPAIRMTRHLGPQLQHVSVNPGGVKFGPLWTFVVIAQVAVTVLFPVSVFFILRAHDSIQSFDVGFASERFLSARLEPDAAGEAGKAYEALDRRLSAEGLVSGVTFASRLPGDFHFPRGIEVVDSTESPRFTVNAAAVAVDFFDVLGADLLAGRTFNATDLEPGHQVIVVNKAFVERILHGRNAIGRRLRLMQQSDVFEIVGVVENLGMNYACLMMVVCLFACIVPTRRALSIQPTEALRQNA